MKSRSLSLLPAWILAAAIGLLTSVTQAQSGDPATRLGKPAVPPHQRLPEPRLNGNSFTLKLYGSDPDVSLLAGLLADEDALVREQAAIGLGQTDNLRALPHIRRATQDPKPKVRSAAVWAAAQFPAARSGGIILSALEDADRQVVWTALRAVRSVKGGPLEAARPALQRLLGADDAALQAAALATLTHLRLPAGAATLRALLASTSPSVRLRAAENAVLVAEAAAKPSIPALMKLARRDTAGVRGAAVAALGRLDFGGSKDLIDRAGRDGNPLVRRGAVRALHNAARKTAIGAFLDDPSPMVRLAAIRAAGELRCADCVGRLFTLMCEAPYDDYFELTNPPAAEALPPADAHLAARAALGQIATEEVARLAAERLARLAPDLKRREAQRVRVQYYKGEFNWMLTGEDVRDWDGLWRALRDAAAGKGGRGVPPGRRFWQLLPSGLRNIPADRTLAAKDRSALLAALNAALKRRDLFRRREFIHVRLEPTVQSMLDKLLREHKAPPGGRPITADLAGPQLHKLNRLLLDAAFPRHIRPGPGLRPLGILRRDATACCHLLGAMKSRRGYDVLLDLLGGLPVDSRAMSAAAAAAARIGDARAVKPLTQAVRACQANGLRCLIASASMQPAPDPYDEHAAGVIVQSLGELGGAEAADEILAIANTRFQNHCLVRAATSAARVLPGLTTRANRQGVHGFLLAAVRAEGYPTRVRLAAAKAAAGLKLRKALPELRDMLQDQRESRTMIHVAAWAIQEITGRTPALTDPKPRPGDWIIRAIRRRVERR